MSSHCKNYSAYMVGFSNSGGDAIMFQARCKQWSCGYCAKKNRDRWLAVLLNALNGDLSGQVWYFCTITAWGGPKRVRRSLRQIQMGFSKFVKRLSRLAAKAGHKLSYVRVYERHKDGAIHLHMICNYRPDDLKPLKIVKIKGKLRKVGKGSRALCNAAVECGLGYIFQYEEIAINNAGFVASYICKYMTKAVTSRDMPKGIRRVQTSRDIKYTSVPSEEYQWKRHKQFMLADFVFITAYVSAVLKDITDGHIVTFDDFISGDEYDPDYLTK